MGNDNGAAGSVKTPLPLAGVRILDLTHILAGPFCASILADFGADVIKIEPPKGEQVRGVAPFIERNGLRVSGAFLTLNRNRRGVALDLKSASGKEVFRKLVAASDVVLENFSPGTMDRLGLGYESLCEVNPRIIYVAISGFGQLKPYIGPWSGRQANNATSQAMSGLMSVSGEPGEPPVSVGAGLGDTIPGLWAAMATLLALRSRTQTDQGQFIDVAMYDCLASMCFNAITDYHVTGVATHGVRGWPLTFTSRLKCADGYIAVSMWGTVPERWHDLFRLIGRPDMIGHEEFDPRHPGCERCFPIAKATLEAWLSHTRRDDAVKVLLDLGFSVGPVQDAKEVYECEHLKKRELFIEVDDGIGGSLRTTGTPVKFSRLRLPPPRRAPFLGEHTAEVLQEALGLSPADLARLGIPAGIPGRAAAETPSGSS
ncbi:MAG: CaiB/BaiF CoA transferase family protein [Bryobacteraceae bacterium]